MNILIAEKLLAKVMNWDANMATRELPPIQYLANIKYDSYDQFVIGARFIGSLALWLNKFKEDERETMFSFVRNRLIFISSIQMYYLVTLLYNTKIFNIIANKVTSDDSSLKEYQLRKIEKSDKFKQHKRMSLFIGLSDGAHMDILRRVAGLNNEQVLTSYSPNEEKVKDLIEELKNSGDCNVPETDRKFETLFLIDDFTASGSSFIRKGEDDFHGKLVKIIRNLKDLHHQEKPAQQAPSSNTSYTFKDLFNENPTIHVLFCVATSKALENIKKLQDEYLKRNNLHDKLEITIDCVQMIESDISARITNDETLMDIISQNDYFNEDEVITNSYKKGTCNYPYLGYDECALPLVLSHNTPNNSIAVLWQPDSEGKFPSLFPRVNRH